MKNILVLLLLALLSGCSSAPDEIDANSIIFDEVPALVVRINPRYPVEAARDKVEGWVRFSFDIAANGSTQNIKVVDSFPKGVFEYEAKRALSKWKYKPVVKNGKTVMSRDMKVELAFRLN